MQTHYTLNGKKMIHITGKMSCPVRKKDGTWTTVIKDHEEDIPDLERESWICNKCGWSTYPSCKEWCKAWITHTSK